MEENKKKIPVLIFRKVVVFPNNNFVVDVARDFSINAVKEALAKKTPVVVATQKVSDIDFPKNDDIFDVGTFCQILKVDQIDEVYHVEIKGLERTKIENFIFDENSNTYYCDVEIIKNEFSDKKTAEIMLMQKIINVLQELQMSSFLGIKRSLVNIVLTLSDPSEFADFLASNLPMISALDRAELLQIALVSGRLLKIYKNLMRMKEFVDMDNRIQAEVQKSADKSQRDYFIREKIKAMQKEVGDFDDYEEEMQQKIDTQPFPEAIKIKLKKEFKKLKTVSNMSLESGLIKQYISLLMELPWWQKTNDNDDLKNAANVLNKSHYGLEDVKERIIEYLAIKKMKNNLKSPILCFFGPPGVGKTSIAKSIAESLNRKFFKISLGGMSDEAELRGHRRTYVGAMPGRIITALQKCKVRNPVILLDEIDKISKFSNVAKGDPLAALLEILDPEQNKYFNDNFVEESFDLSDVLFIATANKIDDLPSPLIDRLEIIEIHSYLEAEKVVIARNFLINKQLIECGLNKDKIIFPDKTIKHIIKHYTLESGVRNLERAINKIIRKVIVESLNNNTDINNITITTNDVKKYLGEKKVFLEEKSEKDQVGVVTGLAYTEYGGSLLPIEVSYFSGKGKLLLTGKLGEVMKESATIAFDYVKARANKYSIDPRKFSKNDVHIHFPEGAIPKDGPSAGVAIALAIISSFSNRSVKKDFALTGEIDLLGNALQIGGLREKASAALRSEIKNIIVPAKNKRDVEKLPDELKKNLKIFYMDSINDAVNFALNNA
ncbi:MAG: endopeptidase La [Bacilli bacterium]|nr:endopeptidase La [Bacilli bacterium]